jgi:hypothetical protein
MIALVEESNELTVHEVKNELQLFYSKDGSVWFSSLSGERLDNAICSDFLYKHLSYDEYMSITHPNQSASDAYIVEYDEVDSKRRALYTQMSDPLYFEAYRAKDDGDISKYEDFKAQADAAVDKIKSENPWPINPEA